MTPEQTLPGQPYFLAQSKEAKSEVSRVTGKTVSAVLRSDSGVLLQFRDSKDCLIIMSGVVSEFSAPKPSSSPGYMEVELTSMREMVTVSVYQADPPDPTMWSVWDYPDVGSLIGQMIIGYSYIMVPVSDGSRTGAACVELSGNRMIAVTIYEMSILAQVSPHKVS